MGPADSESAETALLTFGDSSKIFVNCQTKILHARSGPQKKQAAPGGPFDPFKIKICLSRPFFNFIAPRPGRHAVHAI
jgi:hypothetical protein